MDGDKPLTSALGYSNSLFILWWTEQSSEPILTALAGVVPGSSST